MKKLKSASITKGILIIFCISLSLNAGCKKNKKTIGKDCFTTSHGFCGEMCFNKNYGTNFEESLANLKKEKLNSSQLDTVAVELLKLPNVKNSNGIAVEEEFHRVTFINPNNGSMLHVVNDVIDENGNHYNINWCLD